ncbi:toll-like receptor 3 isoform X1 [Ceratitis capitata]|uniref:toll-like receptor 3 isoform X1 n=1 Tax=Ceratitis capitata TaxID=7213 RepID=UPI00032980D2|nr:toll-like receptor 3 isoform X1 [Ceratitis capitata]
MKELCMLLVFLLLIQLSVHAARISTKPHGKNHGIFHKYHQVKQPHKKLGLRAHERAHNEVLSQRAQRWQLTEEETPPPSPPLTLPHEPLLEIDTLQCPLGCVCQYAHFTELPISRWIQHLQARRAAAVAEDDAWDYERAFDSNEADSDTYLTNPYMKQATCILQEETDVEDLIQKLPHDLHALILLYTSSGRNKSVNLSTLKPLNQLSTLEVRGGLNRSLRILFDEPLSFLQHANFESVTLLGDDNYKRPKNTAHPKDSYDYKPRSESYEDGDAIAFAPLNDYDLPDNIVPYDVYKQELIKSRMPTFYGFEHLQVLRIHGCELNDLQWEMFDGLTALDHLSLERNGIRDVPPFSFYGALHIQTLSLAHNLIHDLHYRALAGLLELEVLDLSYNRLDKLSERSFPPFPKLVRVDFRNNPIRHILPASFWVMNSTRAMDFDSNMLALRLSNNQPFESLVELTTLQLGNVSIVNLGQNIFKGLTALEKLTLHGSIRTIEFDAFAGLHSLRELELSHCGIQEISMDALMDCRGLEVLDLSYNNISYFPAGLLDDQPNLEEIYLQGNQLHTLPHSFFLRSKLRLARLSENPWQCSCEMFNWRPKITNQERGPRTKRCITDYTSGKEISCRRVDSYVYDNRYAPRCNNYNERSVFYVIHKQLQCGPGRVVITHTQRRTQPNGVVQSPSMKQPMPHWRKIEESKLKHMQNKNQTQLHPNEVGTKHSVYQLTKSRPQGINAWAQRNSLAYVIKQEHSKRVEHVVKEEDNEISNEI